MLADYGEEEKVSILIIHVVPVRKLLTMLMRPQAFVTLCAGFPSSSYGNTIDISVAMINHVTGFYVVHGEAPVVEHQ